MRCCTLGKGGWVEGIKAVRMSCCTLRGGGWVGGWVGRTTEDDRELVEFVKGGVALILKEREAGFAREERSAFAV